MKMIVCVCVCTYVFLFFFSGQANKVAKEAANRWTGMYFNGTAKI